MAQRDRLGRDLARPLEDRLEALDRGHDRRPLARDPAGRLEHGRRRAPRAAPATAGSRPRGTRTRRCGPAAAAPPPRAAGPRGRDWPSTGPETSPISPAHSAPSTKYSAPSTSRAGTTSTPLAAARSIRPRTSASAKSSKVPDSNGSASRTVPASSAGRAPRIERQTARIGTRPPTVDLQSGSCPVRAAPPCGVHNGRGGPGCRASMSGRGRVRRRWRRRPHRVERGGDTGPLLEGERGLVDEHPEAADRRGARPRAARRSSGVSSGWYTRSTIHCSGDRLDRQRRVVAHADRRRVHHDLGRRPDRRPATRPRACPGTAATSTSRASTRRAATPTSAPPPTSAAATARAAPPAPSTSTDRPDGIEALVGQRPQEALAVGRVAEQRAVVADHHGVHRVRARRRPASARRTQCGRRGLVRHRHAEPAEPQRRPRRAPRRRPRPGGTSSATYTQSSPAAAKPALWIAGDREWRTGLPMTAARRVAAGDHLITPRRRASAMLAWCCAYVVANACFPFVSVST